MWSLASPYSWLNTFGNDKVPLDERVAWVNEHQEKIYKTGEDYKAGFRFGLKRLNHFNSWLLAGNGTITRTGRRLRLSSANRKDATQSGVQHFAATSLNPVDGHKVNLTDNPEPFDFYEACLQEAKSLVRDSLTSLKRQLEEDPWTDDERKTLEEYEAYQASPIPNSFRGY